MPEKVVWRPVLVFRRQVPQLTINDPVDGHFVPVQVPAPAFPPYEPQEQGILEKFCGSSGGLGCELHKLPGRTKTGPGYHFKIEHCSFVAPMTPSLVTGPGQFLVDEKTEIVGLKKWVYYDVRITSFQALVQG
jgi:hypothetical protein